MRCWVGKEREGSEQGILTLFLEAEKVTDDLLVSVYDECVRRGIRRIYFGAGRVPLVEMDTKRFTEYFGLGFSSVCEMPALHPQTKEWVKVFDKVVIRLDDKSLSGVNVANVCMKLDTHADAYLYESEPIHNHLQTVENGLYTDSDTIIEL